LRRRRAMLTRSTARKVLGIAGLVSFLLPLAPAAASAAVSAPQTGSITLSTVTPDTTVNVGGGTWNYGSSVDSSGTKHCWSHYVHPTKTHSATAIMGSQNHKVRKTPKIWANADIYGGTGNTCYAYWSAT
jgi:lactococcin 972 family bacteriocin